MTEYHIGNTEIDNTDFSKLYSYLFNSITDIINDMEKVSSNSDLITFRQEFFYIKEQLKRIQMKAEDIYIESSDN